MDQIVIEKFLALPKNPRSGAEDEEADPIDFNSPAYQAMSERMGRAPLTDDKSAGQHRYAAQYGSASRAGLLLTFHYLSFNDPPEGARAFVTWLNVRGCKGMRYDFRTGMSPADLLQ